MLHHSCDYFFWCLTLLSWCVNAGVEIYELKVQKQTSSSIGVANVKMRVTFLDISWVIIAPFKVFPMVVTNHTDRYLLLNVLETKILGEIIALETTIHAVQKKALSRKVAILRFFDELSYGRGGA